MSLLYNLIQTTSINRNQKIRWRKRKIIPREVLYYLWELGLKFETNPPETGMELKRFLEFLWRFSLSSEDGEARAMALNLYLDTVKTELFPEWKSKIKPKKTRLIWPERKERPTTITR